jgi:hypothetical protein
MPWGNPLLGVVGLFLLTRGRQMPSGAPDMAIRREQSSRDGGLQPNNTLRGDYYALDLAIKRDSGRCHNRSHLNSH